MKTIIGIFLLIANLLPGEMPQSLRGAEEWSANITGAEVNSFATYQKAAIPFAINKPELNLSAKSAFAVDMATGAVLYEKNADQALPIASITKLVTVLTILQNHSPDEIVTIPQLPAYPSGAELMGLKAGMQLTVGDLIKASLIKSANDAADSLAIWDAGSIDSFTKKMEDFLTNWELEGELKDTSGLSPSNLASARTLASLASLALKVDTVEQAAKTSITNIQERGGNTFALASTNKLLSDLRFAGLKTGYTMEAGQCFVSLVQINGHPVITVILGSQDRFGETLNLVNNLENTYIWL